MRNGKSVGFVAVDWSEPSFAALSQAVWGVNRLWGIKKDVLDEIEDCYSVSDRGEEMGAFGIEQEIALAIDRS
jgi:hypothetical protein